MPNQNFYRDLKMHGEKLYPFAQRKSLDHIQEGNFGDLYPAVKDGVCAAVTVDWLHEKLWKPESADDRNFKYTRTIMDRLLRRPPDKADARERNANTMFANGWDQAYYHQQVGQLGSASGMDALIGLRGLEHSGAHFPGQSDVFIRTHPMDPDQSSGYSVVQSMTRAVNPDRLPKGCGVMITLGVGSTQGHSVAFYRSHGNNLYFFDANSGVYKVNQPQDFIAAWKAASETRWGRSLNLEVNHPSHGTYYLARQPNLQQRPQQRATRPALALVQPRRPAPQPQTRGESPRHSDSTISLADPSRSNSRSSSRGPRH